MFPSGICHRCCQSLLRTNVTSNELISVVFRFKYCNETYLDVGSFYQKEWLAIFCIFWSTHGTMDKQQFYFKNIMHDSNTKSDQAVDCFSTFPFKQLLHYIRRTREFVGLIKFLWGYFGVTFSCNHVMSPSHPWWPFDFHLAPQILNI